jgi:hypothetical protein
VISNFVDYKKQSCSVNEQAINNLEIATQSIAKRVDYCLYHYSEFINATINENLIFDRLGSYRRGGDNVSIRAVYEANVVAFINNLHALLDSFPYVLNIIFPVFDDIENRNIGWNDSFINKYKTNDYFDSLVEFNSDELFQKIKGYSNTTKHKYLIRILNKKSHLQFETFNYRFDGKTKILTDQDIKLFMEECHNNLIPNFFKLCKQVQTTQKTRIVNR